MIFDDEKRNYKADQMRYYREDYQQYVKLGLSKDRDKALSALEGICMNIADNPEIIRGYVYGDAVLDKAHVFLDKLRRNREITSGELSEFEMQLLQLELSAKNGYTVEKMMKDAIEKKWGKIRGE